jgi:hypothetical protein
MRNPYRTLHVRMITHAWQGTMRGLTLYKLEHGYTSEDQKAIDRACTALFEWNWNDYQRDSGGFRPGRRVNLTPKDGTEWF